MLSPERKKEKIDEEALSSGEPDSKRRRSEEISEQSLNHNDDEYDDDSENDQEDDQSPLNTPSKFIKVNKPGKQAEAGVIREVYVENFMCHRKLTVKLCRNVNFINGQNGSGKSAILASIQICLGAGAKRTHRARNLKELIRKEAGMNCAGAKVRVTLYNQGDDAFMHETYGDFITVERSISHHGYNGYKLLDCNGVEKSRSKKDLDAMLDQLNIQVENPVAVLDQEEAKKFLTGKPEDKYNFFTKATDLERLDRSYADIYDNIENLNLKGDSLRRSLQPTYHNLKLLKKEWEAFEELEKLQEKTSQQRILYAWSVYHQENEKVKSAQALLKSIEEKCEKRKQELEKIESSEVSSEEETNLQRKLDALTEEATKATTEKEKLEQQLKNAYEPIKTNLRLKASLARENDVAKREHRSAVHALKEARNQILLAAGSVETEEKKRMKKIKETEEALAAAKITLESKKKKVTSLLSKYEELEPNVEEAKTNTNSTSAQLQHVERKLKELQLSAGSSMAVFGEKCVIMHRKVNEFRNQFRGPVVGPIGNHIKITSGKEQFAQIAEFALGKGTLDRFIVTNDADRKLFMKLRKDARCSTRDCNIFQMSEGRRYEVPPPPCADIETVESVLSIENDLVYNCLVDNCKMDVKALSISKEDGERALLMEDQNGLESIRGGIIQQVYSLPKGDFWQLKRGNRLMISNDGPSLRQTIGVDRTAAIENAMTEKKMLDRELKEHRARENVILEESKSVKLEWNKENREARKTDNAIKVLQETLEALHEEAESAENVTIDTSELEEDVKNAEAKVEKLNEKERDCDKVIKDRQPIVEQIKRQLEEVTTRNESVISDITVAEKNMEVFLREQAHRQETINKKKKKIEQLLAHKSDQDEVLNAQTEKTNETLIKARLITHRNRMGKENETDPSNRNNTPDIDLDSIEAVATDKEPNYYKSKIDQCERKIERERKRRELSEHDPTVAFEKYKRAKLDYDTKVKTINEIQEKSEFLQEDLNGRRKRWRIFRKHIATMTNETFDDMLNKKGSSGQIEFDHIDRTLNLVVQKDNTNENTQTSDVKALSGGERSFTTLSLLLALGESLETPFRVMDEFDVFLDPQSRKIALDTMVQVSKEMEHRQFIFITPQDLSSLKEDRMLKIMKMRPPIRSNVAGGPSQQTIELENT